MSYVASGVTGASPIWHDVMEHLLKDKLATWPPKPQKVITKKVCSLSGLLPTPENPCGTRDEIFIEGTEPKDPDHSHRGIWIDKNTGLPAFFGNTPPEQVDTSNLELQEHTVLSDPFTNEFCLDCAWPQTQELNEDGTPKEGTGRISYPQQNINLQTFNPNASPKPFFVPTPTPTP